MRVVRAMSTFLTVLVVYQGVSLLGWGFGDLDGYFALGPRLAYALVVVAFALGGAVQAYGSLAGIRGARGLKDKRVARQAVVSIVVVTMMYGAFFFLPYADQREIGTFYLDLPLRYAGVVLACAGYALVLWSGIALGSMYSKEVTIQEDHHLVTTGLYSVVRHPRYLGVLLLASGLMLLYRSWVGLVLAMVLVPILFQRIRDEEGALHREFGAIWERYVERTWRLIPHIY
ncbi:MAG: isoprenylcysteine carboxylmethyltransferase family protein [Anaerolineae bacterium]|nr:isoprenylcysteine carboxylmethyltransferase family protein [Anaerolineae bacterium]